MWSDRLDTATSFPFSATVQSAQMRVKTDLFWNVVNTVLHGSVNAIVADILKHYSVQ